MFNQELQAIIRRCVGKGGEVLFTSDTHIGHVHKLCMVKANGLNVGSDCHHFKPISSKDVEFYRNAIENFYDENVFSDHCDA